VPVAELTVSEKIVQNGKSKIYFPQFTVVDWIPTGQAIHLLARTGRQGELGLGSEAVNEDLGDEPEDKPASKKPADKPVAKKPGKAGPRFA
jgi:hypothetical protein